MRGNQPRPQRHGSRRRTLALAGVDLLQNPSEVQAARDSFQKRLAGRTWTTRIPEDGKPPLNYAMNH